MQSDSLSQGDTGPDVQALQQALLSHGSNPGAIDGVYGQGTVAAVMGFQQSEGLLADGIAGPRTLTSLGLSDSNALPSAIPGVTVEIVSQMFPVTPIGNIKNNLPGILSALVTRSISDKPMVLMALSTVRAEVECFEPISEGQSRFNTSPSGHPFDLYDNRKDLGNLGAPDGERYKGRGYVQLTGRSNYETYGPKLNPSVDLVTNPDLAGDPEIASSLLALFLADRELQIKSALLAGNMALARQLVNGGSNGLDRFTDAYQHGEALIPDRA
ncbi:peptidoglycan-binding protein [Paraburkholderia elongata]|uniref:Peptidoglycan-binding protein n=1 Tax=Paraburkholderia elongata TaxID=2675747 RepID=A0A972SKI2_9BURK|nr:peptidoglycan-binding protein [Paraburkholderia elongata]NPT58184.1 peptidoglycan-binding protein [Paraburkholderia elongata]NPT62128.1 peptidoglycan-binding protein [Paraburkholderia elongata]